MSKPVVDERVAAGELDAHTTLLEPGVAARSVHLDGQLVHCEVLCGEVYGRWRREGTTDSDWQRIRRLVRP